MADITPMEPPIDSFTTPSIEHADMEMKSTEKGETLASLQVHTPPETPEQLPPVSTMGRDLGNDPPLFPDTPMRGVSRSMSPLLPSYKEPVGKQYEELINRNEHAESSERFFGSSYDVHRQKESSAFPGILGIKTRQEALSYHRSLVDEQRRWREALSLPAPTRTKIGARRDATSKQQLSRLNRSSGITKPRSVSPTPVNKPVAPVAAAPPRKASKTTKARTEKAKATSEGPSEAGSGQKKHTRAAPTKNVTNKEWRQIEDYSPPISILDGKAYDVRWHGNKIDLTDHPDVEHMHELEIKWASRLRLTPGQYLAIKRLIFRGKLNALRDGRSFTKTAAQNVASLDVNKLSRLHEAFDAVGWFDEKHFEQYLQPSAPQ